MEEKVKMKRTLALSTISTLAIAACVSLAITGCEGVALPGVDNDLDAMEVTVGTNFIAANRAGMTTGVSDESICEGFYPTTPNHTLQIDASLGMEISATGVNGEDLRLWVQSGQSNYCGDGATADTVGRFWTRGASDIYVGTTSNGFTAEYTLSFTPS